MNLNYFFLLIYISEWENTELFVFLILIFLMCSLVFYTSSRVYFISMYEQIYEKNNTIEKSCRQVNLNHLFMKVEFTYQYDKGITN